MTEITLLITYRLIWFYGNVY